MIARLRSTIIAAALFVVAFIRNQLDRLPVSIDRTVSSLDRVSAKLARAEAQQFAAADREVALQNASYDREDAFRAAADRAGRVRARVKALVA